MAKKKKSPVKPAGGDSIGTGTHATEQASAVKVRSQAQGGGDNLSAAQSLPDKERESLDNPKGQLTRIDKALTKTMPAGMPEGVTDKADRAETSKNLVGEAQRSLAHAKEIGVASLTSDGTKKTSALHGTVHPDAAGAIARTKGTSPLPKFHDQTTKFDTCPPGSVPLGTSKAPPGRENAQEKSAKTPTSNSDTGEAVEEGGLEVVTGKRDELSDDGKEDTLMAKEVLVAGQSVSEFPALSKESQQPGQRKAWTGAPAKVFMNSGLGGKLEYTKPTSTRVAIKCAEGMPRQQVWGSTLLGQYVGFYPGYFAINEMMKLWGVKAKFRVEAGWMIFSFLNDDERDKVLKGGPYFIHNRPLLLKHVPDKFAFNRKDIATMPLWVRITGLPNEFWTPAILGRIGSLIGKPLFMDHVTEDRKRGSYARVLVEVNFANDVLREVSLDFDDGVTLECTLLYENEPMYCRRCLQFGHKDDTCTFHTTRKDIGPRPRPSRTRNRSKARDGTRKDEPMMKGQVGGEAIGSQDVKAGEAKATMAEADEVQAQAPQVEKRSQGIVINEPRDQAAPLRAKRLAPGDKGKEKVVEEDIASLSSEDEPSDNESIEDKHDTSSDDEASVDLDIESDESRQSHDNTDDNAMTSDEEEFTPVLSKSQRRLIKKLNASIDKGKKQAQGQESVKHDEPRRRTRLAVTQVDKPDKVLTSNVKVIEKKKAGRKGGQ